MRWEETNMVSLSDNKHASRTTRSSPNEEEIFTPDQKRRICSELKLDPISPISLDTKEEVDIIHFVLEKTIEQK